MKAKSATTHLVPESTRCQHYTTSGRRCKLPVETPGKLLCFTHARELMKADTLNLKTALLTGHQGFQTAQGINNTLGNLYILLANNYISPRRAAVLAFINSLQLRTLPAIDADQAAGITDPTAPKEVLAEPDTPSSDVSSDPAPIPADSSASPRDASTSTSPTRKTPPGWLTEPDPTKKPS